jgi:phage tail-like protein
MRPFSMIRTRDQWIRATHGDTAFEPASSAVQLSSQAAAPSMPSAAPAQAGGMAFDAGCRLYVSRPEAGRVDRLRWASQPASTPAAGPPEQVALFADAPAFAAGDFEPAGSAPAAPLSEPRGLAIDVDDRLFVAESGAGRIVVVDIWSGRVLRSVRVAAPGGGIAAPLDLACSGRRVWALLAGTPWLVALEARRGPWPVPFTPPEGIPSDARPVRVAASCRGLPLLLFADSSDAAGRAWVVALDPPRAIVEVAFATDLELLASDSLVVAHRPGEPLSSYDLEPDAVIAGRPLRARGYDGLGIARAPDGGVVYGTASGGWARALPARLRYARSGRVATYRLDSHTLQNEWGRVFLDACVPTGADVRIHCATTDEVGDEPAVPWVPPVNVDSATIVRPELTPPLPPVALAPAADAVVQGVHRRESGRELPWSRPAAGDAFETYEAPVIAPPGRYLWITLELLGNTNVTPCIRALRAEHASHDLMRRLPRAFSREERQASFLGRYLAMLEGLTFDLDARGAARERLLDPRVTPEELLQWLGGFVGLALDERWPLDARRMLVAEAPELFRLRGTVASLERMLEILLGRRPLIVERFKLRGLGGVLVGGSERTATAGAVVGAGLRVGGAVGIEGETQLGTTPEDAFRTHAHRFAVVVPELLDSEQLATVRDTLAVHRPAHTVFEVCTVGTGMRVGRGLHVGLLATVGRTGGFDTLQLGESLLGRDAVVGRPGYGGRAGETRLGGGDGPGMWVG